MVKRQHEVECNRQDQRHAEQVTQALVHDSSFPHLMELYPQSPQDVLLPCHRRHRRSSPRWLTTWPQGLVHPPTCGPKTGTPRSMDGQSRGPKQLAFPLLQGSPGHEGSAKLSIRGLPRCLLIPIPRKGSGTHISGAGQCSVHLRWPLGTSTTGLARSLSTHECHASLDASNDGLPDSAVTDTPQDFWTAGSKSTTRSRWSTSRTASHTRRSSAGRVIRLARRVGRRLGLRRKA